MYLRKLISASHIRQVTTRNNTTHGKIFSTIPPLNQNVCLWELYDID